ncbi:hypothetical protein F4808DRAFT_463504 [Astrocystis sublimbata]|nr:hypothetical protein F4808DRAFT_463504 [Astrocystis sublimbata]
MSYSTALIISFLSAIALGAPLDQRRYMAGAVEPTFNATVLETSSNNDIELPPIASEGKGEQLVAIVLGSVVSFILAGLLIWFLLVTFGSSVLVGLKFMLLTT